MFDPEFDIPLVDELATSSTSHSTLRDTIPTDPRLSALDAGMSFFLVGLLVIMFLTSCFSLVRVGSSDVFQVPWCDPNTPPTPWNTSWVDGSLPGAHTLTDQLGFGYYLPRGTYLPPHYFSKIDSITS